MILITGGAGFVGRHLITALRRKEPDQRLRVFDVLPPESDVPSDIEWRAARIEDGIAASLAVRNISVVVHLAAKVDPGSRSFDDLARVNVTGAKILYDAAVAAGCRLFIHMSSSGVYGPHTLVASPESTPLKPVTPYQRSKRDAEVALRNSEPKGTTLNILRPAGLYGAGSRLEIPAYRQVKTQRRAFELKGGLVVHPTHADDIVEAILALIEQPAPHDSIFNVGGERPILVQELHAMVASILNVPRQRIIAPASLFGPIARLASPVLTGLGRGNPLLAHFASGGFVTSAVDDRVFRTRFPSVPVRSLRQGLQEQIDWARSRELL